MKIDITAYRACIPSLTYFVDKYKDRATVRLATEFSVGSFVPLIAVCYFLLEIIGEDKDLREMIDRLVNFYGYKEVLVSGSNNNKGE